MDLELEALARLPDAECPAFESQHTPSRKELNLWLRTHDKQGLHAIHQNTISLLRSALDDLPECDISKYGELFGDKLRITHMRRCMPVEAQTRLHAYLGQCAREAEAQNIVI